MIKLKLINPVGDIIKDIELSEWTDIESFKSSFRFRATNWKRSYLD